jgi:hypothetical protein
VAIAISFVIGYFTGREHLRYQMGQALATIQETFAKGFGHSAMGAPQSAPVPDEEPPDPELAKVQIVKASLTRQKNSFSSDSVIELKVKNGAAKAIKELHLHGVQKSPNRTLPWLEGDINYEIPGGLEPSETQDWQLTPGYGSELRNAEDHSDAQFIVTVRKVDWADQDKR